MRKIRFWVAFAITLIGILSGCMLFQSPETHLSDSQKSSPAVPIIDGTPLANQPLTILSQPGPWPYVTGLIPYQGRLWFVNSVVFGNHNSADIYSYNPRTQETRYERHLFSQSAGIPVVANDLLYWPFEDPRFSANLGEYMVTNGEDWRWHILPEGEAFHIHTMTSHKGDLFAGTGAWEGRVQRSQNQGKTWEVLYEHPTPAGNVSRMTGLLSHQGDLYSGLTALRESGVKLLRWHQKDFQPAKRWPNGKRVTDLTSYGDWLYGINQNPDDSLSIWRTNGQRSEPCKALDGWRIRAMTAGVEGLWAVSSEEKSGYLWYSQDGQNWTMVQQLNNIVPVDIVVSEGQVYVGGRDTTTGQGVLLGQPSAAKGIPPDITLKPLVSSARLISETTLDTSLQILEQILSDDIMNTVEAQAVLAKALNPLALTDIATVGDALSQRLQGPFPEISVALFGGNLSAPLADVAQWYILWAIGLNGHGRIPPQLLTAPWTTPENNPEKYWQPVPAAIWVVEQLGQADPETLTALINRLDNPGDPPWLVGDIVGALSTLTGEQFGYDTDAWQAWWQSQTR